MNNVSTKSYALKRLFFSLLALLFSLAGFCVQAEPRLHIDRTQLHQDETLELILDSGEALSFGSPDFSPLEHDFQLSAPRQLNDGPTGLGWQITLRPRHSGTLVIPPIHWGSWQSSRLELEVLEATQEAGQQPIPNAPVFLQASLDRSQVYVQEQAVLTLRIYHSIPLYDDSRFSNLSLPDAHVEALGTPSTYEKTLHGIRHGVIEARYAIVPQRSGLLSIPSLSFTASRPPESATSDATESRTVRLESPRLALKVQPKPASYPSGVAWIPARQLRLTEQWSSPLDAPLTLGNPLTRTLRLQAEGLSAAQLPPLPATHTPGLRSYADQPSLTDTHGPDGLQGIREQREVLIPTQSGHIRLADLDVFWWNTLEDRLEHIILPGPMLSIEAGTASQTVKEQPSPALPRFDAQFTVEQSITNRFILNWTPIRIWQAISLGLAGTTLLGFGLWWRARHQPAIMTRPNTSTGPTERSLLDDLRRACLANDTQSTRQALDAWARQQPETLAEMAARFIPLSEALNGLNGALYSEAGQHWQGDALWEAITQLPPKTSEGLEQKQSTLPPLYPH